MWIRFADGMEGTADFGDFAGKGVFRQWEDPGVWEGMRMSHVEVWGSPRKPLGKAQIRDGGQHPPLGQCQLPLPRQKGG